MSGSSKCKRGLEVCEKSGYALRKSARTSQIGCPTLSPELCSASSLEEAVEKESSSSTASLPPPEPTMTAEPTEVPSDEALPPPRDTSAEEELTLLPLSCAIACGEENCILAHVVNSFFETGQALQEEVEQLLQKINTSLDSATTEAEPLQSLLVGLNQDYENIVKQAMSGQTDVDFHSPAAFGLLAILMDKLKCRQLVDTAASLQRSRAESHVQTLEQIASVQTKLVGQVQEIINVTTPLHRQLEEIMKLAKELSSKLSSPEATSSLAALRNSQASILEKPDDLIQRLEQWWSGLQEKLLSYVQHPGTTALPNGVNQPVSAKPRPCSPSLRPRYPPCHVCRIHTASYFCGKCRYHQCDSCLQITAQSVYIQDQNIVKANYFCANDSCKKPVKTFVFPVNAVESSSKQA